MFTLNREKIFLLNKFVWIDGKEKKEKKIQPWKGGNTTCEGNTEVTADKVEGTTLL